jgi:hypothetical protein
MALNNNPSLTNQTASQIPAAAITLGLSKSGRKPATISAKKWAPFANKPSNPEILAQFRTKTLKTKKIC